MGLYVRGYDLDRCCWGRPQPVGHAAGRVSHCRACLRCEPRSRLDVGGRALAIRECAWRGAAIDKKQRGRSECNGRVTADVATAWSAGYWCLPISMELQPVFLCGPVLLLHRRPPFQRAVCRHVEFVARCRPAGDGILPSRTFLGACADRRFAFNKSPIGRNAETSSLQACAPRIPRSQPLRTFAL